MAKKAFQEYRAKGLDELRREVSEERERLVLLLENLRTGKAKNVKEALQVKRGIARRLTALRMHKINAEKSVKQ